MDFDQFSSTFHWLEKSHAFVIPIHSPYYPPLLLQTASPPLFLFALGNIELLLNPQIAVVGSRVPTQLGLNNTHDFCQSLVQHGLTITSGLAQGIDGEAHRSTLACNGDTIAVCGTGLARVYPASHKSLAHEIANKGLIFSENYPHDGVTAGCFPKRNRIIAGMTLGTFVIEASQKSGSLITAKMALEESREVFAIPGSIHNPLSKGCHYLIKQGAALVETIDDILNELPSNLAPIRVSKENSIPNKTFNELETKKYKKSVDPNLEKLLSCIDYTVTSLDSILIRSQLSIEYITTKLLLLEMDGLIVNCTGGYIRQ
jgi:DNA processing protein